MSNSFKLKIVVDTNALLVSISSFSKYHWFFKLITERKIEICITNDILSEYEEIIERHLGSETAKSVVKLLLELDNVLQINTFYKYNLITADIGDNKFVDCYLAGNCDYIITNDKHFNILKTVDFPKVRCTSLQDFKKFIDHLLIKGIK